jgi:hypothetical protein
MNKTTSLGLAIAATALLAGCGAAATSTGNSTPAQPNIPAATAASQDQSTTIASDITSGLPAQYAAKAGSSGTATVTAMQCVETGDTQNYTCVGMVKVTGGVRNGTDQVLIAATWNLGSNTGTWQVTTDTPQH